MSYYRHHAILVKADGEAGPKVHELAKEIFAESEHFVTELASVMNGIQTFCVLPDGSKEHWPTSNDGDRCRTRFMAAVTELPWTYLVTATEVSFGSDEPDFHDEVTRSTSPMGHLDTCATT